MKGRGLGAVALAGLLSACGAGVPDAGGEGRFSLVPAPGGLDVAGSGGREIGFGRDRPGVLETVARVEGRPPRPVSCAGGRSAATLRDGTVIVFEGETFVGWRRGADGAGRGCA